MAGTGTLTVTPGSGQTVNTLPPSGQSTAANSLPMVLASDHPNVPVGVADGGSVTFGSQSDPAATSDTQNTTYMGLFKRLLAKFPGLGAKTIAGSISVTLASDQTAAVGSSDGSIVTIGGKADTAATADSGTWSLVALQKRELTNWTTYLGRFPASLGAKTSALSLPVVLASDSSALPSTIADGADATLGSKADAPAASWTSAASLIATVDGFWRDAAKDGTQINGVTMPAGGVGINGWLSASWAQGQQALQGAGLGAASGNVGQAALTTTASAAVAARAGVAGVGRIEVDMYCASAWFYGYQSGVTAATGFRVPAGQGRSIKTQAAIYAGTISGSDTLYYDEQF